MVRQKRQPLRGAADFFISYTSVDRTWAEWIAWQLEAQGYRVVVQAWDFLPGGDFVQEMQRATSTTERTVAVLSPAYFATLGGEAEWRAAFSEDPSGELGRLLPVRVADFQPSGVFANRIYVDLVGLDEQAAVARLRAAVTSGRAKPTGHLPYPGKQHPEGPRFPGQRPEIFGVPSRNRNFTDRGELLKALHRMLQSRGVGMILKAGAIHGLDGVGKTQLAIEYAYRYAVDYDLVWWMAAERPLAIPGRLAALARRLNLPEHADQEEQLQLLWDELGQRDRWLLIYDNATQPHDLDRYWPKAGHGHVLITSRNPAWGAMATPLQIEVLPRHEAVAFLRTRLSRDDPAYHQLAAALGDLPLALEQAAAYLEQTRTSLDDYLELLKNRARDLLQLGQPADYPHTVATTWTLSLEQVRTEAPAAEDLLTLCAFLAPDDLPRALFTDQAEILPKPLQAATDDRPAYHRVQSVLSRHSLMTVTEDALAVHRLVQTIIREGLDQEARQRWASVAVQLMLAAFPRSPDDVRAWPVCARLLAHSLAATEHAERLGVAGEAVGSLLNRASTYLWARGRYREARPLADRALAVTESAVGPNHPAAATQHNHLGRILHDLGDLAGARAHFEQALAIDEAAVGPDHPRIATVGNNLGNLLLAVGDSEAAQTQYERALVIAEAALGPHHPMVATVHNNLGRMLFDLGDLAGARGHFERALAIDEAVYGQGHLQVASDRAALGQVLQAMDNT
jgi:tetratricopeptide (TPR) repeat protein